MTGTPEPAGASLSPRTLAEALQALRDDPGLLPVAGTTDLLVADPLRRAGTARVLDLLRIPELRGVAETPDALEIGAATTMTDLRRHPAVAAALPALAAAAASVGGWQIQNRATLGGNAANASPAGDTLPVLLALDATVVVAGPGGTREIAYAAFHTGYRKTALAPGELIVRFHLPLPPAGARQAFRKVGTREAQAISKVVVAMVGRVEAARIAELRLAAGSVAATPIRLHAAEAAALGRPPDEATAEAAGRAAAAEVQPIDDVRSTADYRRFALERVVRRLVLGLGAAPLPW
jgi:CO/xanthine dehydrogenase FAD-binding subunit